MIDIHSHIIPSIDDGCANINEALEIIKSAMDFGITKIFATPHYMEGKYENYKDDIAVRVDYINSFLRTFEIDLEVVTGSEIMICPDIVSMLKRHELSTLNNSRYVLIELPMDVKVPNITEIINNMLVAGFVPVIAHPERYSYVQRDINEVISYVEAGALIQLNISCLIGDYGDEVKEVAEELLKRNLVHLWGSDSHNFRVVYGDKLKKCFSLMKNIVGEEKFKQITEFNPESIYNDEEIKIFDILYN